MNQQTYSQSPTPYQVALENLRTNVVWRCLEALLDFVDPNTSPLELALKIGVSVEEVVECLDGLKDLGILASTEKGLEKRKFRTIIPLDDTSRGRDISNHQTMAEQVILKMSPQRNCLFRVATYVSNADEILKLNSEIEKVFLKFGNDSRQQRPDGIYTIELSGVQFVKL